MTAEARNDMDLVECEHLCDADPQCTAVEFKFAWDTPECKRWQGLVVAAAVGSALQTLCLRKAAAAGGYCDSGDGVLAGVCERDSCRADLFVGGAVGDSAGVPSPRSGRADSAAAENF